MANDESVKRLAQASFAIYPSMTQTMTSNPWIGTVDKLSFDNHSEYEKVVRDCRFYFRHDPLASTVINKLVDIAINDLVVEPEGPITVTEQSIFDSLSEDLIAFLRKAAFEYLITGLLVPEIKLTRINKLALRDKYIKRLTSLLYPTSMWIRDSKDIEIKRPLITEKESYFLKIPMEVAVFLQSGGTYADGDKDVELYKEIVKMYPEFVKAVIESKEFKILLDNPLVIKSLSLADSAYPIPYLYPALEALKHKRNLRRMDYSVAARVISAILHVKVGNDDYPLTEDQEDVLTALEEKFKWRENLPVDEIERVFAFFTNHTVELDWVFPDVETLLDDKKYDTVNQDILVALGFPRILITGETERSFASDPQIATLSPIHTMEKIQKKLLPIAKKVFLEMRRHNRVISNIPRVSFKPINLMSLQLFYDGLQTLYESGNLSRASYTKSYGFDYRTEMLQRAENEELIEELDLDPVAPSNVPGAGEPGRSKQAPEKKKPVKK